MMSPTAFTHRSGSRAFGLVLVGVALLCPAAGIGQTEHAQEPRHAGDAVERFLSELGELIVSGQEAAATARAEVALVEFEKTGDRRGQATCLSFLSVQDLSAGETERAMARLERNLGLLGEIRHRFAAAAVARLLGALLTGTGQLEHGELVLRRGLDLLKEFESSGALIPDADYWLYASMIDLPADLTDLSDPFSEATRRQLLQVAEGSLRDGLGEALTWRGRLAEAETELERAVELTRSAKSQSRQRVVKSLALLRQQQGRYEEARRGFEALLEELERSPVGQPAAGIRRERIHLYELLARLDRAQGKPEDALAHNARALETARSKGDRLAEAMLLKQRAELFRLMSDLMGAKEALDEAREAASKLGDQIVEAIVLTTVGTHARETGSFEAAVTALEQAVALLRGKGEPFAELVAQLGLVASYKNLGALEQAQRAIREAQQLARNVQLRQDGQVAFLADAIGRLAPDDEVARQALQIVENVLQGPEATFIYTRAPKLLLHTLQLIEAKADWGEIKSAAEAVLEAARKEKISHTEAMARMLLGHIHQLQNRTNFARQEWQEALALLRRRGGRDLEAKALAKLADLAWDDGQREEAVRLIAESVEVAEKTVAEVHLDELSIPFFAGQIDLYDRAMVAFAATGQPGKAFEYSERARARGLLRLVGNPRLRLTRPGDAPLATELDALRSQMSELEEKLTEAIGDDAEKARADLESAWGRYEDLIVRIRLQNPAYAELVSPDPADLETVQKEILGPDVTLISYYVLNYRVVAWVIDRENYAFVSTQTTRDDLEKVRCFTADVVWRARQRGSRPLAPCGDVGDLSKDLYEKLLAPVMPRVRHTNLILVPHDALHALPFAALRNPATGRYLIEDYTLSYTPSASILRLLRQKTAPAKGRALVLGDPQTTDSGLPSLSFARREAQAVAHLLGTEPQLGSEATENSVRALGGHLDLLHVAAHAIYRPANPRFSYVALAASGAQDGRLEMHEIFDELDLEGARLVVLSACETALGERSRGDEIVGFIRGFLHAGSPAVMATLWSVDDEASAILIEGFYQRFLRGLPAAEALHGAQLELRQDTRYAAPYFWAGYTLTGDPETRWQAPR